MSSSAYRNYVLGALTLVYTWNYLDRGLIALFLQSIKEDLRLSDTQLGFITGIPFALFYATVGLVIARWADRGNRVTIASIAICLWSMTVMLTMFVGNFLHMVFARIAAAVGESGCMPPTYSLVGDYFSDPADRTRAMSVYMLASPLSALFSFVVGGILNAMYGWRVAFLLLGIPGLFLAILVWTTIREPRKQGSSSRIVRGAPPPMKEVLAVLWRQLSARNLLMAFVLLATIGLGLSPWYATFLIRSHGMNTAELGVWLGSVFCFGGVAGTLMGGFIVTRWLPNNERGQMRLVAMLIATLTPLYVLFLLVSERQLALAVFFLLNIVFSFFLGPCYALLQRLVSDEMRATTLAVLMLLSNLIGMGLGPQLVGLLSDKLMPVFGGESLRYAMLSMSFIALWAAYHLWRVSQTVANDIAIMAATERLASETKRCVSLPDSVVQRA